MGDTDRRQTGTLNKIVMKRKTCSKGNKQGPVLRDTEEFKDLLAPGKEIRGHLARPLISKGLMCPPLMAPLGGDPQEGTE